MLRNLVCVIIFLLIKGMLKLYIIYFEVLKYDYYFEYLIVRLMEGIDVWDFDCFKEWLVKFYVLIDSEIDKVLIFEILY